MKKIVICSVLLVMFISLTIAQLPNLSKDITGAAGPGKLLTQFVGALKPSSFTSGWAAVKDGILGKAQKTTDPTKLASSISSIAGYIKPDMFKKDSTTQNSIAQMATRVTSMAGVAGLLKNLEGGLKPTAFLSSWASQRTGWLSALNLLK